MVALRRSTLHYVRHDGWPKTTKYGACEPPVTCRILISLTGIGIPHGLLQQDFRGFSTALQSGSQPGLQAAAAPTHDILAQAPSRRLAWPWS